MKKSFLGFGLGAIQSGLMLMEAVKSGNFNRFVISEVNAELVDELKKNGNTIVVNTATKKGIEKFKISNIEVYNPNNPNDLIEIRKAISVADEIATAIPSVDFYDVGENSIAKLLARNINLQKQQILYASENNNYAAEILLEKILQYTTNKKISNFQILNTVIGKMSGVIQDAETIKELNLDTLTAQSSSAILVEEFNHIIISKVILQNYKKGIEVFIEKENLLPFEEAKLFGHNAIHSMLGFLGYLKNYKYMSEIRNDDELMHYGKMAFQNESGAFLIRKYENLNDSLFTKEGFDYYGDDLLKRMTNPYLRDEVKRICRDPIRKLGYNDRLIGTIKEALKQNIVAETLAKGVLGGLCFIIKENIEIGIQLPKGINQLDENIIKNMLLHIWRNYDDENIKRKVLEVIFYQFKKFKQKYIK